MTTTLGYTSKKLQDKADKRYMHLDAYVAYLRFRRKEHRKSAKKRSA